MENGIPFHHDEISTEQLNTEIKENNMEASDDIFIPNSMNIKQMSNGIYIHDSLGSAPTNLSIYFPELLNSVSQLQESTVVVYAGESNSTFETINSHEPGHSEFAPELNITDTVKGKPISHSLNGDFVGGVHTNHTPPAGSDALQNGLISIHGLTNLVLPTKNQTEILRTCNTKVLPTYPTEELPTYPTEVLHAHYTEVQTTHNSKALSSYNTTAVSLYNTELPSSYKTEELPTFGIESLANCQENWDLDPNFLDENTSSRISPPIHKMASPPNGIHEAKSSYTADENHMLGETNNYISNGTSANKEKHNAKWEIFDDNEDKILNGHTDKLKIPSGDANYIIDHIVSTNPDSHSKHESKTHRHHEHKKTKHKKKSKKDSSNLETSQISNCYNKPHTSKDHRHSSTSKTVRQRYETEIGFAETEKHNGFSDTQPELMTKHLKFESGRNSASSLNKNENFHHLWKHISTTQDIGGQPKTFFGKPFDLETESEDVSLYQPITIRPHSVATSVFLNDLIFSNIQDDPLPFNQTSEATGSQLLNSCRSPKWSSLPEESNMERFLKNTSSPKLPHEKKIIFKTPSSASLLSDSSLTNSPPIVSSRGSQSKLSIWKNKFSDKKKAFQYMPLDDSMSFGTQSSSLAGDINHDNTYQQEHTFDNADGEECQINSVDDKEDKKSDVKHDAKPETRTAVYKRRWYLLFLFSVSAFLWNAVWSTWGPIAQSAERVYGWTDGDIAMFVWLGNIPFLITMFPSSYLMDVVGMKMSMIVACTFMFFGAGFRCIPSDVEVASWLIRIGQFLNGMAGSIPNSGPALLSALWFPPNQRASATALSTVAGYMGASFSFVIGPLLVPEPNDLSPVNGTDDVLVSFDDFLDPDNSTGNTTSYEAQKQGIMIILYSEFAVAGLLLLLVLIYFPSKPPLPPSISASIPREKYIAGLKMLVRNKQFWVVALTFSVPVGVYEAWQVILDVNLSARHISQETAGWLDFYATVGGCVSGLLICRFVDFFTRQMKLFLLVFYTLAAVSILWFTLVVLDILPYDEVSIYAAIIIAGVFIDGAGPLFFELSIEVSYPVGEGVASGFIQMLCAAAGIVFLSVVQVESLGTAWMNWCFLGCFAAAIPLLFFIKTTYGRADIDDMEIDVSDDEEGTTTIEAADSNEKTYLFGSSHV